MIAFDVICSNGHRFECWFRSSESFEKQKSSGVINCPICNDNHVEMAFTTFAIKKHGEKKKEDKREDKKEDKKEDKVDLYHAPQVIYDYIDKNFEDVGLNFTGEALKIHYGVSKKRNIKGVALPDQEKLLRDIGVEFFKIPIIKRLDN